MRILNYSPAFGFTFDSDEYSSQIAAIDSVVAQYQEAIQGGRSILQNSSRIFKGHWKTQVLMM